MGAVPRTNRILTGAPVEVKKSTLRKLLFLLHSAGNLTYNEIELTAKNNNSNPLALSVECSDEVISVRVVKYWNKLPASVVTAPSVNAVKKRLEKSWTEVSLIHQYL